MPEPRTFLIAEDEAMIAMLLEDFLDLLGHKIAHMVASVPDGLDAIAAGGFDAAILDVNLARDKCWPLADALKAADIPYVFATGGGDTIPAPHVNAPTLAKPYTTASLEAVLANLG
ncbi:response regulator [Blastomonas aquatica]|uniref:Response regulator n=1 Tax=Blastomonas aquatica TaxID=1510276 RepID=A0ABQ1JF16_9SPHN|nr:response regulator [Blastomonas aquatica]GGB65045.1 response regulator [Blastomonas aquatica]